jgi:hypothetical protein
MELLNRPELNKGTAFTDWKRTAFALHGLLPPHVETLEEQTVRAYEPYQRKNDDLERHIYLRGLQDTNEVLFYRLLLDHIEEMTPIVYAARWRRAEDERRRASKRVAATQWTPAYSSFTPSNRTRGR